LDLGYWPRVLEGKGGIEAELSLKGSEDWAYEEDLYSTTDTEWQVSRSSQLLSFLSVLSYPDEREMDERRELTSTRFSPSPPRPRQTGALYRMHRFRTPSTPLKGLTSDILVRLLSLPSSILSRILFLSLFLLSIALS
jgi:hypothetical protein